MVAISEPSVVAISVCGKADLGMRDGGSLKLLASVSPYESFATDCYPREA
ncbi:hypothetical protein LOC71_22775 [Rhodopirellula sp. JC740]|uniref:Uncharacterized protein n=1 Tax=Rhodopirellula halodulae TaxID=2894198 RepID=A0ABS8NNF1_9BACT|nr:hypothetical protein [Rhodopirellula sp. JC740]MCC9645113.1 hypothetical protein [Rhodopirellula sp. JC740]